MSVLPDLAQQVLSLASRRLPTARPEPRRAWRRLARELIPHFAEVQLACPYEICGERERATRWHLGSQRSVPHARRPSGDRPDVVWGSLEELLRLAQRLQRAATVKDYAPKPSAIS